jgi:hypothetical protein
MTLQSNYAANLLLKALPAAEYQRLSANLEPVDLNLGQTIYETDQQIFYVYFPIKSIISLNFRMCSGSQN